jgi:hypothetical protein
LAGKGGGLALFWNEEVKVNLISFGNHHTDVKILEPNGLIWRYTFIYGEPRAQDMPEMWKLLHRIKQDAKEPWLMMVDFNEAMWQHEIFLATNRNERQMENFCNALSDCNLHDLGFSGLPWTYKNKQHGRKNARVRLDRAVACPRWSIIFPQTKVKHLISSRSDHCPILVDCSNNSGHTKGTRYNCYEMMWEREASLEEEINVAWGGHTSASCLQTIHQKLNATMESLQGWSSLKFGAVSKEINSIKKDLEWLYANQQLGYSDVIKSMNQRLDEHLMNCY